MSPRLRALVAVVALALTACKSTSYAYVPNTDVAEPAGEPIAVIQVDAIGFTAIFHVFDIVKSDLDVVTTMMIQQAKLMGATKVDFKSFNTTPREGIWRLTGPVIGFPYSSATGIAVK